MDKQLGRGVDPDLRASASLRDRIGIGRPMAATPHPSPQHIQGQQTGSTNEVEAVAEAGESEAPALEPVSSTLEESGRELGGPGGAAALARHRLSDFLATTSLIEPGDVVVDDPDVRGSVRRADSPGDRTVVGIALSPAKDGWVEVAMASVVEARVDAGYGAILAGDLLVSSPTPGAAMLGTAPEPGTILGKALEPFDSGVGTIRVLVMLR